MARESVKRDPARVEGVVVDPSGAPAPGAWAVAYRERPGGRVVLAPVAGVRADAAGRFAMDLPAGVRLLVAFLRPGGFMCDEAAVARGRAVVPDGDAVLRNVVLPAVLAPTDKGDLEIEVRDETGAPLPGMTISVDLGADEPATYTMKESDAGGRVQFHGLGPGTRRVVLGGTRSTQAVVSAVDLAPGGAARCVLVARRRAAPGPLAVTVRCEDTAGRGLAGARVRVTGEDEFHEVVRTGETGEVILDGLPEEIARGLLIAWVSLDGFAMGAESVDMASPRGGTSPLVVRLKPAAPRPFEPGPDSFVVPGDPMPAHGGTVVDRDGVPVEEADVTPVSDLGEPSEDAPWVPSVARTDSRGRFLVESLPEGTRFLAADFAGACGWGDPALPAPTAEVDPATPRDDLVLRLPFALADIATLECRVVDDAGAPVPGATVTASRCVGYRAGGDGSGADAQGRVVMAALPGRIEVEASGTPRHREAKAVVDVAPGARAEIELVTPRRAGEASASLLVTVVDGAGAPVPGALVALASGAFGGSTVQADEAGIAAFDALPSACRDQAIFVLVNSLDGEATVPFTGPWPPSGPARLTVVLKCPLRVVVTDADTGEFLPDANFSVDDGPAAATDTMPSVTVDLVRGEAILHVRAGEVRVRANGPDHRLEEAVVRVVPGVPTPPVELRLRRR